MKDEKRAAIEPCETYSFDEAISAVDVGFLGAALKGAGEKEVTLSDELLGQFMGATCSTYSGSLTLWLRDGMLVGYRYETQDPGEAADFAAIRKAFSEILQRSS